MISGTASDQILLAIDKIEGGRPLALAARAALGCAAAARAEKENKPRLVLTNALAAIVVLEQLRDRQHAPGGEVWSEAVSKDLSASADLTRARLLLERAPPSEGLTALLAALESGFAIVGLDRARELNAIATAIAALRKMEAAAGLLADVFGQDEDAEEESERVLEVQAT